MVRIAESSTQSQESIDRLHKTVSSTTASATCEGWSVLESEEFRCRIGLPDSASLSNGMMHFETDKPIYTFETSERDLDFEPERIADDTERYLRGFDRELVSENLDVGEGLYCRAFVHEDDGIIQLGRIYIHDEHVWVITASLSDDEPWAPGLEVFFDQFQPTP